MPYERVIQDDFETADDRFEQRQRERRQRAEPSAADTAADESERHVRRAEIRRKVAAAKVAEQRCVELSGAIAEFELKKDLLASQHVELCAPLQSEKAEIETKAVAAIVDGIGLDEALEARRKQLLAEIREANAKLQADIEDVDRLCAVLWKERKETAGDTAAATLENQLLATASPHLRNAVQVFGWERERAGRRIANAHEMRPRWPDGLYETELAAAEAELARATAAADRAYQAAIDE